MTLLNTITKNKRSLALMTFVFSLLLLLMPVRALADGSGMVDPIYYTDGTLYPVVDYADLLTDEEEAELAAQIKAVEDNYHESIVILTLDSLGDRSPMEYADDFYDYNGYGYGENKDGMLFLLSMENRDWHLSTTGSAINAISDSDREDIFDSCSYDFSYGNYYDAFSELIRLCSNEFQDYINAGIFTTGKFIICLLIGMGLALIPLFIFIAQLLTVHPATGASDYTQGGLKITSKSDRFVRSSISKTKITKNEGGSSTHTGSSGTSHGGGGGHF